MNTKFNLTTVKRTGAELGNVAIESPMRGTSRFLPSRAAESSGRRMFLKQLGGSIVGATAVAAGIDRIEAAAAFAPLWKSAQILVGNSPADQSPSQIIKCPLFFVDGHFADASHTLDLSLLRVTGKVRGTITFHDDTIEPDFSSSVAAAITRGTDGLLYLLVGGEGKVLSGSGFFESVNKAIIRCKYKAALDQQGDILLIACVDCVIILVRDDNAVVNGSRE